MYRRSLGKLTQAAQALYEKPVTEESLRGTGFTVADFESDVVEVWPENHRAVQLFQKMTTQWHMGMGGPTGLNHLVLLARMDRMNLPPDEYDALDEDIRCMEIAALNAMNKKD